MADDKISKTISYTVEELQKQVRKRIVPLYIEKVKIFSCEKPELPGEVFKTHKTRINLEASNYGRIRYNYQIVKQKDETPDKKGWLIPCENIPGYKYVYQIVCDIWLGFNPGRDGNYFHRHHINNNGYDNRPENLIWVSKEDHREIHKYIKCLSDPESDYVLKK